MAYVFIIPLLAAIYYVLRGERDRAFLNVYLPCTFLMPAYYACRIPHFPLKFSATTALLPIGLSLLFSPGLRYKFRRMDLWVVLFAISYGYSAFRGEPDWVASTYESVDTALLEMAVAYLVGRMLIEPDLRTETAKRIVLYMVLLTPCILFEYRMAQNPWLMLAQRMGLIGVNWFVQFREGRARIAACYGHAILAGMIFLCAIALNFYLRQIYKRDKTGLGPWMSVLQKYQIPMLLLTLFLLLTRSRAPIGCALLCLLIVQIPKFDNMRAAAVVVLIVIAVGGAAVSSYLDQYTSGDTVGLTEEQSSAIYRRQLLEEYQPILDQGGWLGYGVFHHPKVSGLASIDNDYMLVQLSQGKLGLYLFFLIAAESMWTTIGYAIRFHKRESLFLVFGLMGALFGLFLSLTTVYLGEQMTQVLFLLLGWSQSLRDTGSEVEVVVPKYAFQRVIAS